jgi:hypothetical protein
MRRVCVGPKPGHPISNSEQLRATFDQGTNPQSGEQPLRLCDRCGEEIALANDLDQAGDIDRRRDVVLVASKPCRLAPTLWRLFTLLHQHRSDVVDNDRLRAEPCREMEQPLVANVVKENVRRLRRALAGSRYEIVNHPTLGYELIVRDVPARRRRH